MGSKHQYTFYLAAISGLVTLWTQEEPAVKHIASGKVLPAAKSQLQMALQLYYK